MAISLRRQRGMSMSGMLFTAAIVAGVVTVAIQLIPHYVEFSTIKSFMEDLKDEPGITDKGSRAVLEKIGSKLYINNVEDVTKNDFTYKKGPNGFELGVAYEVRTPLFGNLDAMMTFSHQVTIFGR